MIFLLLVFIVGFSGIVAQTLLLRELLILSESAEIVVSVIISSWLLSESFGAIFTDKLLNERNYHKLLKIYSVGFTTFLFLSVFFVRYSRDFIGVVIGQHLDFINITTISFLVFFPLGFFHMGLFVILSGIKSVEEKTTAISKVYFYEIAGTLVGGSALSFFLLRNFNIFFIILITSVIFIFILFLYLQKNLQ